VHTLNERVLESGKKVFKHPDNKFKDNSHVLSDIDPDLIFIIPFTECVKLRNITVCGLDDTHYPCKMKVYINQENVDFDILENKPLDEFDLLPNLDANGSESLKFSKY
jgi:hypothetical protein